MTVPLRGISALMADPLERGSGICSTDGEGGYPPCPPSTYAPDANIHCPAGQIIGPASAGGVCTPVPVSPPIIYPTAQPAAAQPSAPAFRFPTTPTAAQISGPADIPGAFHFGSGGTATQSHTTAPAQRRPAHRSHGMGSFCSSGTSDTAMGAALILAVAALAYLAMR